MVEGHVPANRIEIYRSLKEALTELPSKPGVFGSIIFYCLTLYGHVPDWVKKETELALGKTLNDNFLERYQELAPSDYQTAKILYKSSTSKLPFQLGVGPRLELPETNPLQDVRKQLPNRITDALANDGSRSVIAAPPGVGKSQASRLAVANYTRETDRQSRILTGKRSLGYTAFHFPTRELQDEMFSAFRQEFPDIPSHVIRGMSQPVVTGKPKLYCERPKDADRIRSKHLSVKEVLCPTCPYQDQCEYQKQFEPLRLSDPDDWSTCDFPGGVLFMMHDHAVQSPMAELNKRIVRRVIDEDFTDKIMSVSKAYPANAFDHMPMPFEAQQVLKDVHNCLKNGKHPKSLGYTAKYLKQLSELCDEPAKSFSLQGLSQDEAKAAVEEFEYNPLPGTILRKLSHELHFSRDLPHVLKVLDNGMFVVRQRLEKYKSTIREDQPVVFLDATAPVHIYSRLWPNISVYAPNVPREVKLTRVVGKGTTMARLIGQGDRNIQQSVEAIQQLVEAVIDGGKLQGSGLIVTYKDLRIRCEAEFEESHPQISWRHFGEGRGINAHQSAEWCILIGRPGIPEDILADFGRALTQPERGVDMSGEIDWNTEVVPHLMDCSDRLVTRVRRPDNDLVRQIQKLKVNSELLQAAERVRPVGASQTKQIYMVGLEPVDIPTSEVIAWNNWLGISGRGSQHPGGRLEAYIAGANGVLICDYKMMVRRGPWNTEDAARREVTRSSLDHPEFGKVKLTGKLKIKGRSGRPKKVYSWVGEEATDRQLRLSYLGKDFELVWETAED
ncbi:hypothetical protein [Ruegeria sp. HKCCC2117]|uniref:hypothetical protein n=1 Tax=Ruegeria sp. HKCCC2117 TaxID=2682992 RepID=UPI00148A043D|nr:hypothetical protein [Ruegeria sp. HKCCC2117]